MPSSPCTNIIVELSVSPKDLQLNYWIPIIVAFKSPLATHCVPSYTLSCSLPAVLSYSGPSRIEGISVCKIF